MVIKERGRKAVKWPAELEALRHAEAAVLDRPDSSYEERARFQWRKWRALYLYVRAHPFEVGEGLPREEQWRRVLEHIQRTVGEPEIVDWLIVQREIAAHLAAGIQDLRPRRNGPCHAVLLEFIGGRRRKALAVLRWTLGKNDPRHPSFPGSG